MDTGLLRIIVFHPKESHRPTKLEVMFYHTRCHIAILCFLLVALTVHLHSQLVQRVVIAPPNPQRIPGITTHHLPLQSHLLGLLTKSIFLRLILQLE